MELFHLVQLEKENIASLTVTSSLLNYLNLLDLVKMLQSHRLHFYMQDFIRGHIYKHSEAQGYIAWQ